MKVAIIDYGAGNVCSVEFALERLGINSVITYEAKEIQSADKVIFPGVGSAPAAMRNLKDKELDRLIPSLTQPVLGICLGMQLFCDSSEEGNTEGLGIIPARAMRFSDLKVPHMGWNSIEGTFGRDDLTQANVYYVHSYYIPVGEHTTAVTDYGIPFSAMIQKDNFYGMQFHPEKSGAVGEALLQKFLSL